MKKIADLKIAKKLALVLGGCVLLIAGLTFLLVYQQSKDPERGRALAEFIRWAIHDGQAYAEPLDYARLPDAVVKVNEQALALLAGGAKKK